MPRSDAGSQKPAHKKQVMELVRAGDAQIVNERFSIQLIAIIIEQIGPKSVQDVRAADEQDERPAGLRTDALVQANEFVFVRIPKLRAAIFELVEETGRQRRVREQGVRQNRSRPARPRSEW